ncbi:MAG: hypothetical protein QOI21_1612 [Actinomycetota bacterium]|jgi:hypothetical protein|nr:hypothetical protein [Actinomycetota bacterium]
MTDSKNNPQKPEPDGGTSPPSEAPAAVTQPNVPQPEPAAVPAEETVVNQQPPPAGPPPFPYAPPPQPPSRPGRVHRAVRNRAVQLVGVGVLGMVIGGGIVGGVVALSSGHDGPRDGRGGYSQHYDQRGGPGNRGGFDQPGRGGGPRG